MQIMDAVRAGRRYVKGCPKLPDTMTCPCPQLVRPSFLSFWCLRFALSLMRACVRVRSFICFDFFER